MFQWCGEISTDVGEKAQAFFEIFCDQLPGIGSSWM
jgi:hypothetical protein